MAPGAVSFSATGTLTAACSRTSSSLGVRGLMGTPLLVLESSLLHTPSPSLPGAEQRRSESAPPL